MTGRREGRARTMRISRGVLGSVALAVAMLAGVGSAAAVDPAVRRACANDYFAHCSMHAPDSPGVRQCMRAVGTRLSKTCISALNAAGEITAADRRRAKQASAAR